MTNEPMDDVLKALRDELAAVSPSPEFQARVRQRLGGEMDLLRQELAAIAPSPEFAVRVRQGIEEAQAARAASWWRFSNWRVMVPAAAAAVVVLAILLRPDTSRVEQATAQVTPAPVGPVAAQLANDAAPGHAQRTSPNPVVRRPQPRVTTPRPVASTARAATTLADPFLEVMTNQPAILRANRALIRAASEARETPVVAIAETNPEIVVAPVEVSPIVVKWMVEPPPSPSSGGAPVIRRVTAETAERSAK